MRGRSDQGCKHGLRYWDWCPECSKDEDDMTHHMNKAEALQKDREFYVEYDDEYNEYGVFGDETGFCYLLSTEDDCEKEAKRLNESSSWILRGTWDE